MDAQNPLKETDADPAIAASTKETSNLNLNSNSNFNFNFLKNNETKVCEDFITDITLYPVVYRMYMNSER